MAIYGFRLWFNWEVRQLPLLTYGRRKGSSYLILNYFKLSFWGSMSETQFFAHSHPQAFFHSDPENFLVFSFKLYVKLLWHPHFFFPFFLDWIWEVDDGMNGKEREWREERKDGMKMKGGKGQGFWVSGERRQGYFSNFKYYLLFKRRKERVFRWNLVYFFGVYQEMLFV